MNLNRKSPVPLWVVLSLGVIIVGGVYVAARMQVTPKVPSSRTSAINRLSTSSPVPKATSSSGGPPDWQTYQNTRFGYSVRFPSAWTVLAPGEGAGRPATDSDEDVSLLPSTSDSGVFISVKPFASYEIGSYYSSATNVESYIRLLLSAPGVTNLNFTRELAVGGHRAFEYQNCYQYEESKRCEPSIYLEDKHNLITIEDILSPDSHELFGQIVSWIRFTTN